MCGGPCVDRVCPGTVAGAAAVMGWGVLERAIRGQAWWCGWNGGWHGLGQEQGFPHRGGPGWRLLASQPPALCGPQGSAGGGAWAGWLDAGCRGCPGRVSGAEVGRGQWFLECSEHELHGTAVSQCAPCPCHTCMLNREGCPSVGHLGPSWWDSGPGGG